MDQKSKSLHDEIIMLEAKSTLEGEIRHSSIRKENLQEEKAINIFFSFPDIIIISLASSIPQAFREKAHITTD